MPAAALAVLGALLVSLAPRPAAAAVPALDRPTTAPRRCPVPAPVTAAGFQALFDAKHDDSWSGGDQAASFPLPDGRVLWLFGDTVLGRQTPTGRYAPGARMVHNSFLLQDRGCLQAVRGPHGSAPIPDAANGDYFWPLAATTDRGRLVVTVARIRRTGRTAMDFAGVGTEAAVFTLPRFGTPRLLRMARLPSTGTPEEQPHYGHALVASGGFTYVYASRKVRGRLVFGTSVSVARVPSGRLLDLRAWRYWDGRSWRAEASSAASIVTAEGEGWSTSFSVIRRADGAFQYVTKGNGFLGSAVLTGLSRTPQGAFSRVVAASYPSFRRPHEVLYNPLAHPEQRLRGGGLLVTICRNSTAFSLRSSRADLYKPQFFSIPAPAR